MAERVPMTWRPVMVSTVMGSPKAPAAWAKPLSHILSGFSAVSGGRFFDRSAGSRSTRSTSTQSPALQRVASVKAVTPLRRWEPSSAGSACPRRSACRPARREAAGCSCRRSRRCPCRRDLGSVGHVHVGVADDLDVVAGALVGHLRVDLLRVDQVDLELALAVALADLPAACLLYTSPSPRD